MLAGFAVFSAARLAGEPISDLETVFDSSVSMSFDDVGGAVI